MLGSLLEWNTDIPLSRRPGSEEVPWHPGAGWAEQHPHCPLLDGQEQTRGVVVWADRQPHPHCPLLGGQEQHGSHHGEPNVNIDSLDRNT